MNRQTAQTVRRAGSWTGADDRVTLDYEARFLRRRRVATDAGREVFVDLPEATSLADGDALETAEGALVEVRAAPEPLLEIAASPAELTRLAWHVGNRHMPAQIEPHRILIRADPVMADMLARLGAAVRPVTEAFNPEGGAYGLGRTHGHHHGGATDHPHAHAHE